MTCCRELYRFVARICDFLDKNINANQSVAERAKAYIEAHYADSGLTLDQVASERPSLQNILCPIQKHWQFFINYLTNVRISHAKEYLKSGNYKTYEVALRCGYENPTYFPRSLNEEQGFHPQSIVMTEKEAVD